MKSFILIITMYLCIVSCASLQQEKRDEQSYVNEFKLRYFKACFWHSFDNEEIKVLNGMDRSGITELVLGIRAYSLIDSLARVTASNVYKQSSIEEGEIAEEAVGKHVYSECLCGYESDWLKSFALREYKKQKKYY